MGLTAPTETNIQRSILNLLSAMGVLAWRNNSRVVRMAPDRLVRFGAKGSPDILGVLPGTGRTLGIEVKRPGQHPTVEQRWFLAEMSRRGALAFVAHSAHEVQERLHAEGVTPR